MASSSFFLFCCVFAWIFLIDSVTSEFFKRGSATQLQCKSQQKESTGKFFDPILKRNDDHHVHDPVNLFVGDSARHVIDDDWSTSKTKNETTGITTFVYSLKNIDFEDAGIYVCDDIHDQKKNFTVIGDKVTCNVAAITTKQGEKLESFCELPVDGPDAVALGWFLNGKEIESKRKPTKPEDTSITSLIDIVATPSHHQKTLECRYEKDEKTVFNCSVDLEVKFDVQVHSHKDVVLKDKLETSVKIIGNPWPGKNKIQVLSDDIVAAETEKDELDNGFGATVTVVTPLKAFQKKKSVNVIFKTTGGEMIGAIDITPPPPSGSTAYIVVIVVLVVAAILLSVLVICIIQRHKKKKAVLNRATEQNLADQPEA